METFLYSLLGSFIGTGLCVGVIFKAIGAQIVKCDEPQDKGKGGQGTGTPATV